MADGQAKRMNRIHGLLTDMPIGGDVREFGESSVWRIARTHWTIALPDDVQERPPVDIDGAIEFLCRHRGDSKCLLAPGQRAAQHSRRPVPRRFSGQHETGAKR